MIPMVSFVGKSGVGKTTLLEKVVSELKRRGCRVAVIKHDVHHFEIDHPGKDTWRFTQAGSDAVIISSPEKMALIQKVSHEMALDELAALVGEGIDIILTEGYRTADKPKIEVARSEMSRELICKPEELIAVASDVRLLPEIPHFGLEDAPGIVDFLLEKFAVSPNPKGLP